jgi:hypothetical protein
MKPSTYCEKIAKKETWGGKQAFLKTLARTHWLMFPSGAIELAIVSDKYKIEIISIDVQSGRTDRKSLSQKSSFTAILEEW